MNWALHWLCMLFVDGKMCCHTHVLCDWDVGVGIVSEQELDTVLMALLGRDQNGRGIVSGGFVDSLKLTFTKKFLNIVSAVNHLIDFSWKIFIYNYYRYFEKFKYIVKLPIFSGKIIILHSQFPAILQIYIMINHCFYSKYQHVFAMKS